MPTSRGPQIVAGVDLGSNSFHMIVARVDEGQLHILDRMRDRVRLAAGLDADRKLTEEASARALACLERFGQRVRELPRGAVRAAGTNTLRQAKNSSSFIRRAQKALGHPIEIISGREEARLIYLGVAHSVPDDGRRLVVDIGGGSTECIIGEQFDTISTESLYMGCISYSMKFFPGGVLRREDFRRAEISALLELQSIERHYRHLGWERCFGSSGTILAVAEILRANGWSEQGITRKGLKKLRRAMIEAGNVQHLQLNALDPERASVLAGGVAILSAIAKSLRFEVMKPSTGALREGLLYDLLGRIRHEDVRDRTIRWFARHYSADDEHAARVERTAFGILEQVAASWGLEDEDARHYLSWAARLHEIGLEVAHTGYHKHSAYIVENADMPGFSRDEQQLLAAIIHAHRRKFLREHLERIPAEKMDTAIRLSVVFRLAVNLNRSRSSKPLPQFRVEAKKNNVAIVFPPDWLDENPLTRADLEDDALRLRGVGIELALA